MSRENPDENPEKEKAPAGKADATSKNVEQSKNHNQIPSTQNEESASKNSPAIDADKAFGEMPESIKLVRASYYEALSKIRILDVLRYQDSINIPLDLSTTQATILAWFIKRLTIGTKGTVANINQVIDLPLETYKTRLNIPNETHISRAFTALAKRKCIKSTRTKSGSDRQLHPNFVIDLGIYSMTSSGHSQSDIDQLRSYLMTSSGHTHLPAQVIAPYIEGEDGRGRCIQGDGKDENAEGYNDYQAKNWAVDKFSSRGLTKDEVLAIMNPWEDYFLDSDFKKKPWMDLAAHLAWARDIINRLGVIHLRAVAAFSWSRMSKNKIYRVYRGPVTMSFWEHEFEELSEADRHQWLFMAKQSQEASLEA